MLHANACGQGHTLVLARLVAHHHHAARAFGHHGVRNLRHAVAFRPLAYLLATRHGDRVVVENFVSDVHARRNRLANGQEPAVKVGAVAQVGKHMRLVHKGLLAHPGHALAAHLREARGGPVHPQRHVVATNAGHGTRALRHFGAGVVRAARAKPGRALGRQRAHLQRRFARGQKRQVSVHAGGRALVHPQLLQALGNGLGNQGGREVGIGAQQGLGAGVGQAPLAA